MKKISFLVLLFLVFFRLYLPGIHTAHDLHQLSLGELKDLFSLPSSWSDQRSLGLGEYSVPVLWSYPTTLIFGSFGRLGLPFNILVQFLAFTPFIILSYMGMSKLSDYYGLKATKLIGIFLYLTNSYILLLLDGGQLDLVLAYSVLPLCFYLYRIYLDQPSFKSALHFGLSVSAISFLDIRVVFFILILILVELLLNVRTLIKTLSQSFFSYLYLGFLVSAMLVALHAYWLWPAFFALSPSLPLTYDRPQQVGLLSFATLGHSLSLLSPHWYKNIFGQISPLRSEFFLIPILVFLISFASFKSRKILFWMVIGLLGAFLAKGTNEPFGSIYSFLFIYLPGFNLFRDPTKFYFLITLSYSILLSFSLNFLKQNRYFKKLPLNLIVIAFLFFLAWPVIFGQMTGLFSPSYTHVDFSSLNSILKNDQDFGRVVWVPTLSPLGESSKLHPSVEAARLLQKRPFQIGTVGTYESLNFFREASFAGQLLDVAGVKYLAYPPIDPWREETNPDKQKYYYAFLNQLSHLPWIDGKLESQIPLLKTKQHQDHLFLAPNLFWIIGSDDLYHQATKSANLNLSQNALVFAEEYPGLSQRLNEFSHAKIILNQKGTIDLAANFIGPTQLFFPARQLNFQPDSSGWWKRETADLIAWKDFLQNKYGVYNQDFDLGGGWAVSEGDHRLELKTSQLQPGNILLARVLESSKSGQIKFWQKEQLIGTIQTKNKGDNIHWFEVGNLKNGDPITLETTGEINVVNAIAVLDFNLWQKLQGQAKQLEPKVGEYSHPTDSSGSAQLKFEQLSPTEYKVWVTSLKSPQVLVLSESYNGLWKNKDTFSLPVYSLLNGFNISQDGVYLISFEPQKYVYPGIAVSLITLFLLLLIYKFWL